LEKEKNEIKKMDNINKNLNAIIKDFIKQKKELKEKA